MEHRAHFEHFGCRGGLFGADKLLAHGSGHGEHHDRHERIVRPEDGHGKFCFHMK